MILSRYTELFEGKDDYYYLFNCLNLNWVKIEKELTDIFNTHKADIEALADIHPEFYNALVSEGYVVTDEDSDFQKCVDKISKAYNSFDNLKITINPTLDCNVRCWYCYEKKHAKSVMSEETIDNTTRFIEDTLTKNHVKTLNLSFFGGEPLLRYKDVVKPIIKHISEVCKRTSTKLFLSFTTNGLLLSDNVINDLRPMASDISIQMPFDGAREFHNKVKFLGDNASCYDKSVRNAINAIEQGFNVIVRCNYSKETLLSFKDVINDFKDYHQCTNLRFMFQKIWQQKDDPELHELWKTLVTEIEAVYTINSNIRQNHSHSLQKCYADFKNNLVINYDGSVYRCTARDFNESNSIGRITKDGCIIEKPYDESKTINGTSYGNVCRQCRILPICPLCSQVRLEQGFDKCPIDIDDIGVMSNIINVFNNLTNIEVVNPFKEL